MKTIALALTICAMFSGTALSWCPQQQLGIRGRIAQRQLSRNISSQIRLQNQLNQLAIAQSFVAPQIIQQRFIVPQVQSFIVPQVQSFVAPSFVAPSYVQQAPQQAPAPSASISGVTEQLRQLSEMSEALRALKTSP